MLGTYEIINVEIIVNGEVEIRQNIVYYDTANREYLVERFYGEIRDGYVEK